MFCSYGIRYSKCILINVTISLISKTKITFNSLKLQRQKQEILHFSHFRTFPNSRSPSCSNRYGLLHKRNNLSRLTLLERPRQILRQTNRNRGVNSFSSYYNLCMRDVFFNDFQLYRKHSRILMEKRSYVSSFNCSDCLV